MAASTTSSIAAFDQNAVLTASSNSTGCVWDELPHDLWWKSVWPHLDSTSKASFRATCKAGCSLWDDSVTSLLIKARTSRQDAPVAWQLVRRLPALNELRLDLTYGSLRLWLDGLALPSMDPPAPLPAGVQKLDICAINGRLSPVHEIARLAASLLGLSALSLSLPRLPPGIGAALAQHCPSLGSLSLLLQVHPAKPSLDAATLELSTHPALHTLQLGLYHRTCITSLSRLTRLQSLTLDVDGWGWHDLEPLAGLPLLEHLALQGKPCSDIEDWNRMEQLVSDHAFLQGLREGLARWLPQGLRRFEATHLVMQAPAWHAVLEAVPALRELDGCVLWLPSVAEDTLLAGWCRLQALDAELRRRAGRGSCSGTASATVGAAAAACADGARAASGGLGLRLDLTWLGEGLGPCSRPAGPALGSAGPRLACVGRPALSVCGLDANSLPHAAAWLQLLSGCCCQAEVVLVERGACAPQSGACGCLEAEEAMLLSVAGLAHRRIVLDKWTGVSAVLVGHLAGVLARVRGGGGEVQLRECGPMGEEATSHLEAVRRACPGVAISWASPGQHAHTSSVSPAHVWRVG